MPPQLALHLPHDPLHHPKRPQKEVDLKSPSYTIPTSYLHTVCTGALYPHIVKLLSLGVITCCRHPPCFVSRVFLVPKASRRERFIIDLSLLNTFIQAASFKMLDIHKICSSIPRYALFTSIDISNAF